MKKLFTIFILTAIAYCARAQEISVQKIEGLKAMYNRNNDTTYIINFFATWCRPCMEEMPVLKKFIEEHQAEKIQFIFVSLDGGGAMTKLQKYVKKQKITVPVILLNESSDFSWLPYIDKRWQGSIPATKVVNAAKKVNAFFETPLEKGQLEYYLKQLGL